ncbi:MAG: FlgD immunoglobulin-like domain containing protein [Candidatus Krumholzibacteria bacterium]|nr:FlgD immunoglobulin-like domain containing protein [Candidatus Krumholzibacteria bacterium]
MKVKFILTLALGLMVSLAAAPGTAQDKQGSGPDFESFTWTEINDDAAWSPRAGLQVVELRNTFYMMGGRTPIDPRIIPVPGASEIWSDVWRSRDKGASWRRILDTAGEHHWPPRAYFEALTKGRYMYVLGGQDFNIIDNPFPGGPEQIPVSQFFNDVWRSRDGEHWTQMTAAAGWEGRAGLTAVVHRGEIYVMGGSFNDDEAIGPAGPARVYFNDVWKSRNGSDWELLTDDAPWAKRAGARVVSKGGYLYLVGGEAGFLCQPQPCDPPYFNDVWRSRDGVEWELVTDDAPWSPRPGHVVVVYRNHMVLFGGFGLSDDFTDPFGAGNPLDVWVSRNGYDWRQVSDSPWNAVSPEEGKYDFDALVARSGRGFGRKAIYTFGGDRETFDFTDLDNYLNVDNDVWSFAPHLRRGGHWDKDAVATVPTEPSLSAAPNPFNPSTMIQFNVPAASRVELEIFDIGGRRLRTLVREEMAAGSHTVEWNGRDIDGRAVASGVYLSRLRIGETVLTERLVLTK